MISVDTGAWFASVVPGDHDHVAALHWLSRNTQQLIMTDYVVDETLTLLRMRGENWRALQLGEELFGGRLAELYYLTEADVWLAWHVFRRFSDKGWSFTDCTSKVVMEKLQIAEAFAFDHHFSQFGSILVVPAEA